MSRTRRVVRTPGGVDSRRRTYRLAAANVPTRGVTRRLRTPRLLARPPAPPRGPAPPRPARGGSTPGAGCRRTTPCDRVDHLGEHAHVVGQRHELVHQRPRLVAAPAGRAAPTPPRTTTRRRPPPPSRRPCSGTGSGPCAELRAQGVDGRLTSSRSDVEAAARRAAGSRCPGSSVPGVPDERPRGASDQEVARAPRLRIRSASAAPARGLHSGILAHFCARWYCASAAPASNSASTRLFSAPGAFELPQARRRGASPRGRTPGPPSPPAAARCSASRTWPWST